MGGFNFVGVYRHEGFRIDYTNTTDDVISAGTVVVQGTLVGLVTMDIQPGEKGALCVEGVWELPCSDLVEAAGTKVYWTGTAVSATSEDNTYLGMLTAASTSGNTTCLVRVQNA